MNFEELSLTERRAFAIFLRMERNRHLKDIASLDEDLKNIEKTGIDINKLPDYGFIEVPEVIEAQEFMMPESVELAPQFEPHGCKLCHFKVLCDDSTNDPDPNKSGLSLGHPCEHYNERKAAAKKQKEFKKCPNCIHKEEVPDCKIGEKCNSFKGCHYIYYCACSLKCKGDGSYHFKVHHGGRT